MKLFFKIMASVATILFIVSLAFTIYLNYRYLMLPTEDMPEVKPYIITQWQITGIAGIMTSMLWLLVGDWKK